MVGYGEFPRSSTGWISPDMDARREFSRADVAAFGKARNYNDSRTYFWVRLTDGTMLFVRACDESKEDRKWLVNLSKLAGETPCYPTRVLFQVWAWVDVVEGVGVAANATKEVL